MTPSNPAKGWWQVSEQSLQPMSFDMITGGLFGFAGEGSLSLLQYSCLGNLRDRGGWGATVHGIAKSQTHLATKQLNLVLQRKVMIAIF